MWKEIPWTKGAYSASNSDLVKLKENISVIPSERQKEIRLRIAFITGELNKKAIFQYTLDGTFIKKFETLADVHREYGYNISAVSRAACCKQKTSYGYLWKWDEDSVTTIPQGSSRTGANPAAKDESRKV